MCDLTPYSEDLLKEYSKDLKSDISDIVEKAYKFFYCNRVSYNGVGGFSTSGIIRRNMSKSVSDYLSAIDGLYDIHNRLSGVIVHNTDAIGLIEKWDKQDTFIYCDPPYHQSTRTSARYKYDMDDNKQKEFIDLILSLKKCKMIISAYKCTEYDRLLFANWNRIDIEIKTQNNNRKGKSKIESLYINY